MKLARNYFFRNLFILILMFNLLVGCVLTGAPEKVLPESSQESVSSEVQAATPMILKDHAADDEGEARFVDGPVEDVLGELPALGNITFTTDHAYQTSGAFVPGGMGLELSLTDSAGLTWTITLPPGALNATKTVTMTALKEVQSTDIPGNQAGGVLLEPDGLQLQEPGTLSVMKGGLEGKALFLGGNHDGTKMNFVMPKTLETGSGAEIWHFSAYTVIHSTDPKIDELRDQGIKQYEALAKKARELLKNKSIDVPRPPSIPLHCPKDENEAEQRKEALKKFEEDFRKPESDLLGELMALQTSLSLMGVNPDFTLEVRLVERLLKKVNLLIKEYGNQAEHVSAISQVGVTVAREIALLDPNHTGSLAVMEALGRMSEQAINELLKELREQHEYRNIAPILEMSRRAALVGVDTISVEDLFARIERVFQFEMKLNWEMGIEGESRYTIEGEFPMRSIAEEAPIGTLLGSGEAEMVSAKFDSDEDWFVESAPFHVKAMITGFDACKSTAYLSINRFYPDVENHFMLDSDGEVTEIGSMPLMQIAWKTLYEDRKKTGFAWYDEVGDYYTFELQLRDKDATAVYDMIETIDLHPDGTLMGWLSVTLTHTPK